jgi:RNA polymerase sigma factor (sigma-70 family)
MTADPRRSQEIAAFYERHQRSLERIVTRQVRAPGTIVEDACQTAWARLCAHPEVVLEEHAALRWLVTTAAREAWKRAERVTARETPAGAFRTTSDVDPLELAEPAAEHASPCDLAIAHAEHEQRVHRLRALTDRERLYLYLQGLGYSYTEMAQSTAASRRTVERQVLRACAKLNARKGGETRSPRSSEST